MAPSDFQKLLTWLDPQSIKLESMTLDLNSVYSLSCAAFPPLLSLNTSELKVLNVQNVSLMPPFLRSTNLSKLSIISSDGRLSTLLNLVAENPRLEEVFIISRIPDFELPIGGCCFPPSSKGAQRHPSPTCDKDLPPSCISSRECKPHRHNRNARAREKGVPSVELTQSQRRSSARKKQLYFT